jgi:hypothetical protein
MNVQMLDRRLQSKGEAKTSPLLITSGLPATATTIAITATVTIAVVSWPIGSVAIAAIKAATITIAEMAVTIEPMAMTNKPMTTKTMAVKATTGMTQRKTHGGHCHEQ